MRPIGVTLIAILNWLRASLFALGGLALIGVGHLSARLVSAVATDSIFQKLVSFLGKSLGPGRGDFCGSGTRSLAPEELGT